MNPTNHTEHQRMLERAAEKGWRYDANTNRYQSPDGSLSLRSDILCSRMMIEEGDRTVFLPHCYDDAIEYDAPRMPLRDWFAGMALSGYLADTRCPERATPDTLAAWCYANADAMLAARKGGQQ